MKIYAVEIACLNCEGNFEGYEIEKYFVKENKAQELKKELEDEWQRARDEGYYILRRKEVKIKEIEVEE
jgi:hypothetical protein